MFTVRLFIPVIFALSITLIAVACQENSKNFTSSTVQSTSETVSPRHTLINTNFSQISNNENTNNENTNNEQQSTITKGQFINAFNQLYSGLPDKDSIQYIDDGFSTLTIDNYSSGNGGNYILAFSQYYRARGIIIVFKNDGSKYIPIHMEKFDDTLVSMRFLSASVGTISLFEVVSQDSLGSGRNQLVRIFSIETKSETDFTESFDMSLVWKYNTISNSISKVPRTKDTYTYSFNYASYIVIPTYLFPIIEKHDAPTIVVNDTHEVFTARGDEQNLTSVKEISNTRKNYIWDNNFKKFIERK